MNLKSLKLIILSTILIAFAIQSGPLNAAANFILPNPIFAAYAHPIGESNVYIWAANFEGSRSPNDVDANSIIINGSLVPVSVEVLNHDLFGGDALEIGIAVTDFLPPYGLLWDTALQNYRVDGYFNDGTPLLIEGTFTSIGHISGNVNGDISVNIQNLNFMVANIFRGGLTPSVPETADVDGSCTPFNMRDLNYTVNYIFRGGSDPTHCTQ